MSGTEYNPGIDVSVVIPARNEAENIQACLQAIFDQQTRHRIEVLVIDSGSTDATVATARAFRDVRVLTIHPAEFGHGKTRNLGAAETSGSHVVFLNADALPADRNWLEVLIDAVGSHEKLAGVFSRHLPREGCDLYMERDLLRSMPPKQDEKRMGRKWDLMIFSTVSCIIPRRIWEAFPFDNDIDIAEDQAWARWVKKEGFEIRYEADSKVVHSHNYRPGDLYRIKKRVGRSEKKFTRRLSALVLGLPLALAGAFGRWLQDIPYILGRPLPPGRKWAEIGKAFCARAASFSGRFIGWITA